MIAIQCTQKLLKQIGHEYTDAIIPTFPLGCWHANLLILDRRKCVLFTNDLTKYSFLVPGLRKPHFQMLEEIFSQALFKCLLNEGFSQEAIEKVLDEIREIAITRAGDRSVLGTMNDTAYHIKAMVAAYGLMDMDISMLNHKINRIPLGPLGYKYSIEKLKEALTAGSRLLGKIG
jgi:hypothetical protein